jgi:hypothetical protein
VKENEVNQNRREGRIEMKIELSNKKKYVNKMENRSEKNEVNKTEMKEG